MSHQATKERAAAPDRHEPKAPPSRSQPRTGQSPLQRSSDTRTAREIRAAVDAIPPGSVTARTAGALRVAGPRRTFAEARAAFEGAVAEENTRPADG